MLYYRKAIFLTALMLLFGGPAIAAKNTTGAVEQTGGYQVPQNPTLPKLNLSAAQREQIRKTLATKHSEVEFKLKTAKAAKDFNPKVGAKLPKGIKPLGIPSELSQQIPQLEDYAYTKMKNQILVINAMTGKIVEIIPETQPQTIGQH